MFKNIIIVTFRNLAKNRLFSFINIGGLALGLTACFLIFIYVKHETSFDAFVPNSDNIYKLETDVRLANRAEQKFTTAAAPLAPMIEAKFPEVEHVVRLQNNGLTTMIRGDENFAEVLFFADPGFFDIFALEFVEGEPNTALANPLDLVLTKSVAEKYFGDQPALGETVTLGLGNSIDYRVTAVIEDLPDNSHLAFGMLAYRDDETLLALLPPGVPNIYEMWYQTVAHTYLELADGASKAGIITGVSREFDGQIPDRFTQSGALKGSDVFVPRLTALRDIHLDGAPLAAIKLRGNKTSLYGFIGIALLTLLIAAINFINLMTARATKRAREVALRKVAGARRSQLITQFLSESVTISLFALLVSLALTSLLLPWFNSLVDARLALDPGSSVNLAVFAGLSLAIGLVAGLYPAFVLSKFRPAKVLRTNKSSGGESAGLRAVLVTVQFAIAIGLIISTQAIISQVSFSRSMDLGYTPENLLVINGLGAANVKPVEQAMMRRLSTHADVLSVTRATSTPASPVQRTMTLNAPYINDNERTSIALLDIDYDYFATMGIELVAGRVFSERFGTDGWRTDASPEFAQESTAILNESAVANLGFASAEDALGKVFTVSFNNTQLTIVGVVKDFVTGTTRESISPRVFVINAPLFFSMIVRYQTTDLPALLAYVDSVWSELVPDTPINRNLEEENVANLYARESVQGNLLLSFSLLAIAISSIGLYAMASFAVINRTLEIGVRKVLGAKVMDVMRLLIFQFTRPVMLANLLAWPVAWYFLSGWLQGFAYRIDLSLLFFVFAALLSTSIAWLTVGGHAWQAARKNPIHALRNE